MKYVHRLPSEQLTMVMRYQNIIQNDKDIQKQLSKKNQNQNENEFFELLNWLSMNYHGYRKIYHPVEFNEDEYDEENI